MSVKEIKTGDPMTERKIETCKLVRAATSQALHAALRELFEGGTPISEAKLRNKWLEKAREYNSMSSSGWYGDPKAGGFGVLFATENEPERVNYNSLRPKKTIHSLIST